MRLLWPSGKAPTTRVRRLIDLAGIIDLDLTLLFGGEREVGQSLLALVVTRSATRVTVSAKIVSAADSERPTVEIVAKADCGIITLGLDGRVLEANSIAQDLLPAKDSITQLHGRLTAVDRIANDRLQQARRRGCL